MSKLSPTQRSLDYLRGLGYKAEVVEHYHYFARKRHDLFGLFDILALHEETDETMVVQTTSTGVSSRVAKITESEFLPLIRKRGWTVHIHGWRKSARDGKYKLRVVDLS